MHVLLTERCTKCWQLEVSQQMGKMWVRICAFFLSKSWHDQKWTEDDLWIFIPQSGDFTLTNPDVESANFWYEGVLEVCSLFNSSFTVLIIIIFPNHIPFWATRWYFPFNAAYMKVFDWNTATPSKILGSRRLCWLDIADFLCIQEHFAMFGCFKTFLVLHL